MNMAMTMTMTYSYANAAAAKDLPTNAFCARRGLKRTRWPKIMYCSLARCILYFVVSCWCILMHFRVCVSKTAACILTNSITN